MAWDLTGNAHTNPTIDFVGTTDSEPLVIRTGKAERLRVGTNGFVGIGTNSPRSVVEAAVSAPGALGPSLTLTNTGGGINAAAAVDLNTFQPPAAANYNPSSRIEAVDDGNYANDIVFLSNTPGAPNNGLVERVRIASTGQVTVSGDLTITGNVNASGVTGIAPPGSGGYTAGVHGISDAGWGVWGESNSYYGVIGEVGANGEAGVYGKATNAVAGVIGCNTNPQGLAGVFFGSVNVTGTLQKGGGGFHIDHPLDPQNQYLNHSFVESSDMKNLYDGIAVLDDSGQATVTLPDWFDTLNENLRYQLTPIGAPAPQLHLAEEIAQGTFRIAGGSPRQRISWQVTGSRKDPWAKANPLSVEEPKPAVERGHYLHPELFGADQALSFMAARFPKMARGGR